mgnify:CR=1 FL=1
MAKDNLKQFPLLFCKLFLVILICFSLNICSSVAVFARESGNDFTLTIIHTNDLHAHDEPYLYKGKTVSGAARFGHIIRTLRANAKKEGKNVVVADAGDVFQGSTLYSHYQGDVEVKLLNMLNYDIFTLGNHEFDDGASNVAKQFKQARFQIINSNLDLSPVKELNALVKPHVIKQFGKEKVAFVGAITPQIELLSGGLQGCKLKSRGREWTDSIAQEVKKLKEEGINKIILVTHCGVDEDQELARAIPDVDAIIGGHSHTVLKRPIIVKHDRGRSTTIVQTGSYGHYVGKLELSFDSEGKVKVSDCSYGLHPVDSKVSEEKDIKDFIAERIKPLLHLRQEIVGFAGENFGSKIRRSDSSIGNLVCDALYELGRDYGIDIAMHNRGGIRGHLDKGPISVETVEQILPFDNYAVFSTVKGSVLLKALEHSLAGAIGGKFMDVRGLKVAYDPNRKAGKRLVFVLIKHRDGSWSRLNPEKSYKLAINSYNFAGGEGYSFKGASDVVNTKIRMAQVLQKYLLKHKKVYPQKPHRLVAIKTGLLANDKNGKIILSGVAPGARLSVIAGSEEGVSTIYNAFPVPVKDASVVDKSLTAGKDGRFYWPKNKNSLGKAASLVKSNSKSGNKVWLCIVAYPPKKSAGNVETGRANNPGRTLISNPVSLAVR